MSSSIREIFGFQISLSEKSSQNSSQVLSKVCKVNCREICEVCFHKFLPSHEYSETLGQACSLSQGLIKICLRGESADCTDTEGLIIKGAFKLLSGVCNFK